MSVRARQTGGCNVSEVSKPPSSPSSALGPTGEEHQVRSLAIKAGISFELARRLVKRLGEDAEMTEWAAATLKRRH
jgi:hypothetical protein